jgi:hypothetical protein
MLPEWNQPDIPTFDEMATVASSRRQRGRGQLLVGAAVIAAGSFATWLWWPCDGATFLDLS